MTTPQTLLALARGSLSEGVSARLTLGSVGMIEVSELRDYVPSDDAEIHQVNATVLNPDGRAARREAFVLSDLLGVEPGRPLTEGSMFS